VLAFDIQGGFLLYGFVLKILVPGTTRHTMNDGSLNDSNPIDMKDVTGVWGDTLFKYIVGVSLAGRPQSHLHYGQGVVDTSVMIPIDFSIRNVPESIARNWKVNLQENIFLFPAIIGTTP
jgi:hypothetical protein